MNSRKPLKIHLYKIQAEKDSTPLEDLIARIQITAIEDRERRLGSDPYRLEEAIAPTTSCPYWCLDFTRLRFDGGPGKASASTPVESFDLGNGYGFAEETAVLLDLQRGWAVVQYNHFGARANAIAEYLSIFDPEKLNAYELRLQLNPSAQARLAKKVVFTKLKVRVAPTRLTKHFRQNNVGLVSALEANTKQFGGDVVTIEIGLDRSSPTSLKLSNLVPSFLKMANEEHEAVDTLIVSGRDGADMPIDPVDLIKERLEISIKGVPLDVGLRYPRNERYSALIRAANGWSAEGIMR